MMSGAGFSGLSQADINTFFGDENTSHTIASDLLARPKNPEPPMVLFVAGQPSSLKTTIEKVMAKRLGLRNPAWIDADRFRGYHPKYLEWASQDDRTAAARTHEAAAKWVDMAIRFVIKRGCDAVVSATLKDPEGAREKVTPFQQAKYQTSVVFTAVHRGSSRLGVIDRYLKDHLDAYALGRYVPADVHDAAYTGVLETANELDAGQFGNLRLAIYRPDVGLPIYERTTTGSTFGNGAATAIQQGRVQHWNANGSVFFRTTSQRWLNYGSLNEDLRHEVARAVADIFADVTPHSLFCLQIPVGHPDAPA
ncbi:zeta toxin family protein [Streptomyces sp. M2CJ-2]|uniref:zeta toxin family protein n=1 Tax=Streptomyces sp. M2CJ-2 TaxID=2803948 RepID=UPI001926F89C|nr:zeta toxin family protein [Streptomyces sp. M2CJ-2]MBL3668370.1 zeta toxin family protein [Streptomyces sp. M2CJ-2]